MRFSLRFVSLGVMVALLATFLVGPGLASASARTAHWAVSVTYQNVGTDRATISVNFFAENSDQPIAFNPLAGIGDGKLAANAGASFFIGSVTTLPSTFQGSAVISSDQPLVATVVQFASDSGFKMRLLSNGFQTSDASNQYLVPTTLLNTGTERTSVFSIQNTETFAIIATAKFYNASNGALASTKQYTIPAQSSKYVDMDDPNDTGLGGATTFNGSAIVTATKSDDANTPGNVVIAVSEYYNDKNVAANFEGVPLSQAATTVYLATGLCRAAGLDTFYAVQNASLTQSTFIKVTYRNKADGSVKTTDGPYQIGPGQKKSIITCSPSSGASMVGFSGSATIDSTTTAGGGTAGAPIVVIGKAQSSVASPDPNVGTQVFTAFLGQPVGYSKLALPFIRWAKDADYTNANNCVSGTTQPCKQRSFIAIQNLESTSTTVNVKYFDKNGTQVGSTQQLVIPGFSKANSDPNAAGALTGGQFGYYNDGTVGGAVTVEAASPTTAKIIAIVRVQNPGAGEDYNGLQRP